MTSRIMEECYEEGRRIGEEEGRMETALRMLAIGKLTLEEIAQYSDLPLDEVKRLAGEERSRALL